MGSVIRIRSQCYLHTPYLRIRLIRIYTIFNIYMHFVLINTHIKLLAAICFKLAASANLISNAHWNTTAFLPLFLLVATGNLISIKRYNVLYVNKLNVFLRVLQNSLLKAPKFGPYKIQKRGWLNATSLVCNFLGSERFILVRWVIFDDAFLQQFFCAFFHIKRAMRRLQERSNMLFGIADSTWAELVILYAPFVSVIF